MYIGTVLKKSIFVITAAVSIILMIGVCPVFAGNDVQTAEPIFLDEEKHHQFDWDNDEYEHYYKFIAPSTGYYQIDILNYEKEETYYYIYDIYGDYVSSGGYDQFCNKCWSACYLKEGNMYFIELNSDNNLVTTVISNHSHQYKSSKKYTTGLYESECKVPGCEYTKLEYTTKPTIKKVYNTKKKNKKVVVVEYGRYSTYYDSVEVQFSTSPKFTSVISHNVDWKYVGEYTNKLKKGKKYYVRTRFVYKREQYNGETSKFYSSWSKVKTIKVK